MIGVDRLVPETPEQADQRYRDYVSTHIESGDLAGAAHAMMDCRSVYHHDRVWYGTAARPVRSYSHAIGEAVLYQDKLRDLGLATRDVYQLLRDVDRSSTVEVPSHEEQQGACSQGVCFDALPIP